MCKAKLYKNGKPNSRIDKCMMTIIDNLNIALKEGVKIVGCCCGHGKYPMTIIVASMFTHYDLISGEHIPRKRKFYKKDNQGYYFIPEVQGYIYT